MKMIETKMASDDAFARRLQMAVLGIFLTTAEYVRQWEDGIISHEEMISKLLYETQQSSFAQSTEFAMFFRSAPINTDAALQAVMFGLVGVRTQDQFVTWFMMAFDMQRDLFNKIITRDGVDPRYTWEVRSSKGFEIT